jgi:hypothetical protein
MEKTVFRHFKTIGNVYPCAKMHIRRKMQKGTLTLTRVEHRATKVRPRWEKKPSINLGNGTTNLRTDFLPTWVAQKKIFANSSHDRATAHHTHMHTSRSSYRV